MLFKPDFYGKNVDVLDRLIEIGSKEDIYAVEKSVNCGVRIISSTHCANEYELKQKANMVSLMKTGAFQTLVFLSNRTHAGEIVKISQVGDNFAV